VCDIVSDRIFKNRFVQLTAVLVLVYAGVWLFYTQPGLSGTRLAKELFIWPLTLGLLAGYRAGFHQLRKDSVPHGWLWAGAVLLALIAAMIPPFHSTDLFGYINRGWQQLHYGMNPYVYTIDHIPGWESDPMITNHWVNNPSPYGFLYLLVAKALCALGGGSKAQTIAVFKAFNVFIHLLTAGLIWRTARRLNQNDLQCKLALYLYAFNPLVLIHGLANAHNDMLMGLFVLLSAYFAFMGAWIWILPALMAATLVKYGSLVIILPAILLLIKRRQWKTLFIGSGLAVLVFLLCGLPYLGDWSSFHLKEIGRNAMVSHGSLHSCLFSLAKVLLSAFWPILGAINHWPSAMAETSLLAAKLLIRDLLKNTLLVVYALFYASLGWKRLRQAEYTQSQWVQDALLVMAVLVCAVSLKFYPWYFGMFFPLAFCLNPGHWLRRLVILASCAQLFSITFIGQAHVLNYLVMMGLPILWFVQMRNRERISAAEPTAQAKT
jgi:hypothetical protein